MRGEQGESEGEALGVAVHERDGVGVTSQTASPPPSVDSAAACASVAA